MRLIRRIALVGAAFVVLAFTALLVLARVYDAEAKARLLGALNSHLSSPVSVNSMDLTLVDRFPMASIHLRDVLARDADPAGLDTLLFARDLYLEFSLLDLFRGDYGVDRVHGEHVTLHAALDSTGRRNWVIWKADSAATGAGFSLDRVTLEDLRVRFRDGRSDLEVLAGSERFQLGGSFADAGNRLRVKGDAHLVHWRDGATTVLSDRTADLKAALAFGGADGALRIEHGELLCGDVPLAFSLALVPGHGSDVLDLRANGLGLDLAEAVQLLPDDVRRTLDRYGLNGEVDLALSYTGPIDPGPSLSVGLTVRDGRMRERRSGVTLNAIKGECAFDLTPRGGLARLLVKNFSARAASGTIAGSWDMKGLKNAPLKARLSGDIALADLLHFARVDTLEQVAGRLAADVRIDGRVRDVADVKATDLRALRIGGTARLSDATLKMKGIRHAVTGLNATLSLDGNDARVQELGCSVQGNAIALSGELRDLMPYLLFDDQPLRIVAQGASPHIDLGSLLTTTDARAGGDYALRLPALVELDLRASVDELVFERFTATGITGTIVLKDRVLTASPVMFSTASGGVLGSMGLDGRSADGYPLTIDATVKDIDVKQLFAEFQEFGQGFITSHHLSGTATAQVVFTAPLSTAMRLDLDHLRCAVDVSIDDGSIAGHQPLMEVATYVKDNKLVAPFVNVEELRARLALVRFAHLENRIEIRDRQVIIPAMLVQSSAMDIELSGTHGFDDRIDHHINFRLGELFRNGTPEDEFGPVIDDGTGLRVFLHMHGPAGAPRFETDGAAAAQRRSAQVKEQTAELRSILHNELNLFKKNDEATPAPSAAPAPRFDVQWSEGDTARSEVKRPRRKGLGRLLNEEEEEKEVIQVEER